MFARTLASIALIITATTGAVMAKEARAQTLRQAYATYVSLEIRQLPLVLQDDQFVRDYGLLMFCRSKYQKLHPDLFISKWRRDLERQAAAEPFRNMTITFTIPALHYDPQQGGFPFAMAVSSLSHQSVYSLTTGNLTEGAPWPNCGVPNWSDSALPKSATIYIDNTGTLSLLSVARNRAAAVAKRMGSADLVTIRAIVKPERLDFRSDAVAAVMQHFAAYAGPYARGGAVETWPNRNDRHVFPLVCRIERTWMTKTGETVNYEPYLHVRVLISVRRPIAIRPDQFLVHLSYKRGGFVEETGIDAEAPDVRDFNGKSTDVSSVSRSEDLGLNYITGLPAGPGAKYIWVITFPLLPFVHYSPTIGPLIWNDSLDHPCLPIKTSATKIIKT
ncbi:MAG: hypothetical protein HKL92_04760 [Candidatus Eremiobacteraeota bacterium]|nr:hypothetical protein [Candidatus Eremiobacteraeota bacterium]